MSATNPKTGDEFRVDIGRVDKGRTFVRVVHIPSGKERIQVGLDGQDTHEVAQRLTQEIRKELAVKRGTKGDSALICSTMKRDKGKLE